MSHGIGSMDSGDPQQNTFNNLAVLSQSGGDLTVLPPVFSADGRVLFLAAGAVIKSYSVDSGEFIRDYKPESESEIVAVDLHPSNSSLLICVDSAGHLTEWQWEKTIPPRELALDTTKTVLSWGGQDADHVLDARLFLCPKKGTLVVFVAIQKRMDDCALIFQMCGVTGRVIDRVSIRVSNRKMSFSIGPVPGLEYVAGIYGHRVFFLDLVNGMFSRMKIWRELRYTCVQCHPKERMVLTGDSQGRVRIYRPFGSDESETPLTTEYHWHSLPVASVAFTLEGNYFYTGGGQPVLVKWHQKQTERKFLPRLPGPICHISLSRDNMLIAVTTKGNVVSVYDAQRCLVSTIQGLAGSFEGMPLCAGLCRDPRTNCLLLNAKVGSIQFYEPYSAEVLHIVDITGQNYIAQERQITIVNTSVNHVAVSSDGRWMATVEERDDGQTHMEQLLKFWQYSDEEANYELVTCLDHPHDSHVRALEFQPVSENGEPSAVTTGGDQQIRVFRLQEVEEKNCTQLYWYMSHACGFRSLAVGDVSFSEDGSVLASAFEDILVLWHTDDFQVKDSLSHSYLRRIRLVEFGHQDCSHCVVVATKTCLGCWDLLQMTLLWVNPIGVHTLAADPFSNCMAAFTDAHSLLVFHVSSGKPRHTQTKISPWRVAGAIFMPYRKGYGQRSRQVSWQRNSRLFFITEKQELFVLESEAPNREVDLSGEVILQPLPSVPLTMPTPFASLFAQSISSDVKKAEPVTHLQVGRSGADVINKLMFTPAHTLPAISLTCSRFLRSLIVSKQSAQEEGKAIKEETKEGDSGMETDDDDDVKDQLSYRSQVAQTVKEVTPTATEDIEKQLEPIARQSYQWTKMLVDG